MDERKNIYISYADEDQDVAIRLRTFLNAWFETSKVWLRDFELEPGALIAEVISEAIESSNWLVLIYSSNILKNRWFKLEASDPTFRSLENNGFKIIVIKVDSSPFPQHLRLFFEVRSEYIIDLRTDSDDELYDLAELIEKTENIRGKNEVFVDRGADADKFWSIARRNQIVFLWGWSGIGKTAFVKHAIADKLGKKPVTIRLTPGFAADRLAHEILQGVHDEQPIGMPISELTLRALSALKKLSDKFFLFIDDAEQGFDSGNLLLGYLEEFLKAFLAQKIDTHVVLATTRNPDIPVSILRSTDIFPISVLETDYVQEAIEGYLAECDCLAQFLSSPDRKDVVELAGGYPLAAKLIAVALKTSKSPSDLLQEKQRNRIELKAAQDIMKSINQDILSPLHQLILHILAVVNEPITLEDVRSVSLVRKNYKLEELQEARADLADWFLIEQHFEFMSLHRFVRTYYLEHIQTIPSRYHTIAASFGDYAFKKAMSLHMQVQELDLKNESHREDIKKKSNDVFRYALPAERLLRYVGKGELADQLPMQFQGTLRELVFYFYQEAKDYKQALFYAEKWLALNPNDTRISLFRARCYRNFRDKSSLQKAARILDDLNRTTRRRQPEAEIWREKALIAEFSGDEATAEEYFKQGIKVASPNRYNYEYMENYTGLAELYLIQADRMPDGSEKRREKIDNAVSLLEYARDGRANFDLFHLGTYVEALIEQGREDVAFPLLEGALKERPKDAKLNYRMGEILRKRGDFRKAEEYAQKAHKYGAPKAILTLANIQYSRAIKLTEASPQRTEHLTETLKILDLFQPEFGHDQEVADNIRCKTLRSLNRIEDAELVLGKYSDSVNSYTINELYNVEISLAEKAHYEGNYVAALDKIRLAKTYALKLRSNPSLMDRVLEEVEKKEKELQELIQNELPS